MKLSVDEFTHWEHKSITLLGMSGVGKTFLSNILRSSDWFHYSGDYRIGTRYLNEPILDNIKQQAMQVPFIRDLLRSDSIYIQNNITVDHLKPISSFLGKLGNPELGGLSLQEFKRRQKLHLKAEIAAMQDVPDFIRKAHEVYGFNHFINDAGGSVSELNSPEVMQTLSEHTLILYIKATEENEKALIERAQSDPKPLYYQEAFLDQYLELYMTEQNVDYVSMLDPDAFVRWVFPHLFKARLPRYDAIAEQYGYTVSTTELYQIKTEADFVALVTKAVARQQ
jgi:shikimate kinase